MPSPTRFTGSLQSNVRCCVNPGTDPAGIRRVFRDEYGTLSPEPPPLSPPHAERPPTARIRDTASPVAIDSDRPARTATPLSETVAAILTSATGEQQLNPDHARIDAHRPGGASRVEVERAKT